MLFNSISTRRNDNNSTKGLHSAYLESVSSLANAGKVSAAKLTNQKRQLFSYRTLAYFSLYGTVLTGTFLKVIQLWGHIPLPNGVSGVQQ